MPLSDKYLICLIVSCWYRRSLPQWDPLSNLKKKTSLSPLKASLMAKSTEIYMKLHRRVIRMILLDTLIQILVVLRQLVAEISNFKFDDYHEIADSAGSPGCRVYTSCTSSKNQNRFILAVRSVPSIFFHENSYPSGFIMGIIWPFVITFYGIITISEYLSHLVTVTNLCIYLRQNNGRFQVDGFVWWNISGWSKLGSHMALFQ